MAEALREGVAPERLLAEAQREGTGDRSGDRPGDGLGDVSGDVSGDGARRVALGAEVVWLGGPAYPSALAALVDAPAVLTLRGTVAALSLPAIAIVGARAATRSARTQARRLARELAARGFVIVSGLARGIDAEAHRGALEAGGTTVAVLACGLDETYPPEHRELADEIVERGAVVSEMPFGTKPRREYFPLRNRIISGLSLGVVVVEARRRSGSLITVRHALDQGREVWVVPGASDGPFAEGSNRLLREGARAIRSAHDVVEDLAASYPMGVPTAGPSASCGASGDAAVAAGEDRRPGAAESTDAAEDPAPTNRVPTRRADTPELDARILTRLTREPATREDLLADVELDPGRLATALLELELAGRIVEERDGRFHACWP